MNLELLYKKDGSDLEFEKMVLWVHLILIEGVWDGRRTDKRTKI